MFVSPVEREQVRKFIESLVVKQPVKYISSDVEVIEWWTTDDLNILRNKEGTLGRVNGKLCYLENVGAGWISVLYTDGGPAEILVGPNIFEMRLNVD